MTQEVWNSLNGLLGLEREIADVNGGQMALRAILIYAITLAIARMGSQRFLGKGTAFDIIIGIMIRSVMSRAINGSAPFFPTLLAGASMIGLHWIFAGLALHTSWFGTPEVLTRLSKAGRLAFLRFGRTVRSPSSPDQGGAAGHKLFAIHH